MARKPRSVADVRAATGVGTGRVISYNMAGVAPLTVCAGVVAVAFAVTGQTGIPFAFLAVALVLVIFTYGFAAMTRQFPHTGAFYAYVASGLGRVAGCAAGAVAFLAYNLLQVGLYGALAPTLRDVVAGSRLHAHLPWVGYALVAWLVVGVLGLLRLRMLTVVLGVLLVAELAITVVLGVNGIAHHAPGPVSLAPLSPLVVFSGAVGPLAVNGVLGSIGFETGAVTAEATKNRHTVTRATFITVIGMGLVYALGAFGVVAHNGVDKVVANAQAQGPGVFFALAGSSTVLGDAAQTLFLTSIVAAMISFHLTASRYAYAAGRDGVLFGWLARTNRFGAPHAASLTQTGIGLVLILGCWAAGWDPLSQMFFRLGTSGGFGVMCLLVATCLAVVVYFRRRPTIGESRWNTTVAPVIALALLGTMLVYAVVQYPTLIGEHGWTPAAVGFPLLFPAAALAGTVWGLVLRSRVPEVYRRVGLLPTTTAPTARAGAPAAAWVGGRPVA